MTYLVRAKKLQTIGDFALVNTHQELADFIAPLWRLDNKVRLYLFDLGTAAVPAPLSVTWYQPLLEDGSDIDTTLTGFLIQTMSGATLFTITFPTEDNG